MKRVIFFLLLVLISYAQPQHVAAKIELTFSGLPSQLETDQTVSISVELAGASATQEYYLRGAFAPVGSSEYFGSTQNNQGDWHNRPSEHTGYLKIQGNGSYNLVIKPDPKPSSITQTQPLEFKVGRYTPAGSLTWSEQVASTQLAEPQVASPIPTATPTTLPTPVITTSPQPPSPSATPTVTVAPLLIALSEVAACPVSGEKEWVEVFNAHTSEITLTKWKLVDSTGNTVQLTQSVAGQSYGIIELSSAILNNSGDSIQLIEPSGMIIDQMDYTNCAAQTTWIDQHTHWTQTTTPTKGTLNTYTPLTTPTPISTVSTVTSTSQENTAVLSASTQKPVRPAPSYNASQNQVFLPSNLFLVPKFVDLPPQPEPSTQGPATQQNLQIEIEKKYLRYERTVFSFLTAGVSLTLSSLLWHAKWYNLL